MRAFGRDTGRNTEGRRNHVDSRSYVADDNSKRTRIRFHVKGPNGSATVWVEVAEGMGKDDFVYLILRDNRTHKVLTLVDNREKMEMERSISGYGTNSKDALSKLLNLKP